MVPLCTDHNVLRNMLMTLQQSFEILLSQMGARQDGPVVQSTDYRARLPAFRSAPPQCDIGHKFTQMCNLQNVIPTS